MGFAQSCIAGFLGVMDMDDEVNFKLLSRVPRPK